MAPRRQQQQQPHSWWPLISTILLVSSALAGMLVPSRDWGWPAAWFVVGSVLLVGMLPMAVYIRWYNPDLPSERQTAIHHPDCAWFDRIIVPLLGVLTLLRYLAAGLQHDPAGAPSLATWLAGGTLMFAVLTLQTWAVCSNHFFSSIVRIQTDRGHRVCDKGPYAHIRHPGYVAFSLQGIAEALLLQSSWVLVISLVKTALLVIRTHAEDAFLHANLPGYASYAQCVRWRLLPGVW